MKFDRDRPPSLRDLLEQPGLFVVAGAYDALSARIIEAVGLPAVYATGAGITNSLLAQPDVGLISLPELTQVVSQMAESVSIPVIADADTGFGNVVGVRRTVRELERAGAAAIQIEDQVFPKKCGHFDQKQVIPKQEMVYKIKAALDARRDDKLVIIARTDALGVCGFEEAIDRAWTYHQAGAEITFVEAPTALEQVRDIPRRLAGVPQVINLVEGGRTPLLPFKDLEGLSYKVALCANTALRAAMMAVRQVVGQMYLSGSLESILPDIVSWEERQALVGLPALQAWEKRLLELDPSR